MTPEKRTVLIVEDERAIVEILKFNLKREGYDTLEALDGESGLELARTADPDLILLDVMLPKMNGFDICAALRAEGRVTPIIMLTAREEETDKIFGLEAGADDYISKPFSLHEVLARIKAVLRRSKTEPERTELHVGSMTIDFVKKLVKANGEDIKLSPKEFGILSMLAKQPGRVFSREEILAEVWHGDSYVLDRTIDVHIARVRRKLGEDACHLTNRQGYGYCFEE